MNVLVISTNRSALPAPVMPLGACIAAEAAERAGHRVRLLDLMFARDPLAAAAAELKRTKPDVVGLSVRNIDNNDIRNTAFFIGDVAALVRVIRSATGAPVVLGGAALGVMPGEIMRFTGVSCAVLGDGESVFPKLLESLSGGGPLEQVPGVAWMEGGILRTGPHPSHFTQDCPAPDFSRWIDSRAYVSSLATVPLQTKLGCHFDCVYCTYRKIEGSRYRLFTTESVFEAISRLAVSGFRDIELVDNVFNSPYAHALEICEGITRIKPRLRSGVRFQSLELNPLYVDDVLMDAMEKAGFAGIGMTVESASDAVLAGLRKGFTAEDVFRAAEVVRRHDLPCVWIFMLGGPGETEATVRETLRFAETRVRPGDVLFFNAGIRIYPGTGLEDIAREQGVLDVSPSDMLAPVFYVSPDVKLDWMIEQIGRAMSTHMNFINADSIGLSFLPAIHRLGYFLGLRPPLWKHTRLIRRGLRLLGVNA